MIKNVIFPGQTNFYQGKVRDLHYVGNVIVAHTTDRISAFDVVLPFEVPRKGDVLNLMTAYFMEATKDIIPNCLLSVPTPNTSIWLKTEPFKFEVVVRAYNTGSFYRQYYEEGKKLPWDYTLDKKLKKNEKFPSLIVTPTTKAVTGHDEDISIEDIISNGLASENEWEFINDKALELFKRGQKMANDRGLNLVDTKYEFGKDKKGKIYLIDEVHTPDSSRYWYKKGYAEAMNAGEEPRALSKEFVREYLMQNGFSGKIGEEVPPYNGAQIHEITARYLELFKIMVPAEDKFSLKLLSPENPDLDYKDVVSSLVKIRPQIEGSKVSIVMGSDSDLNIMEKAINVLIDAGVPFEASVVSAHRIPMKLAMYGSSLLDKGVKVVIAGAGGAAHLPGMIAAHTILPVIGVPIKSSNSMIGLDSLLSIGQMPAGVPVATMAIDGAQNAGLYALQILATNDEDLKKYLLDYKKQLISKVSDMQKNMSNKYFFTEI